MYVRLAFAVAAHLEPEILIVDEVLAVGDAEFQKKCLGKMHESSAASGRTVLFVSHNMAAVKRAVQPRASSSRHGSRECATVNASRRRSRLSDSCRRRGGRRQQDRFVADGAALAAWSGEASQSASHQLWSDPARTSPWRTARLGQTSSRIEPSAWTSLAAPWRAAAGMSVIGAEGQRPWRSHRSALADVPVADSRC